MDEVLDIVELTPLKDSLVGIPGISGLSVEQRKRLTIAVELVANPSVIFMDEPTSGAAAMQTLSCLTFNSASASLLRVSFHLVKRPWPSMRQ